MSATTPSSSSARARLRRWGWLALLGAAACATAPLSLDPDVTTPATAPGPWRVVERDLPDGLGKLYIPSTSARDPAPEHFPRPLVLFFPGFSSSESDYKETERYLASHGFVVLGAQHDFNFFSAASCMTQRDGYERVVEAWEAARALSRAPEGELAGLLDEAQLAAVGHSYGGKLALWLAKDHPEIGAVVALDPVDGGGERRPGDCPVDDDGFPSLSDRLGEADLPPVAILTAGLSGDCAPADTNGTVLMDAIEDDAVELFLPRATHTDFIDAAAGICLACLLCPASEEDGGEVLALVRGATVAFLRHRLLADEGDAPWLDEGDVLGGGPVVEIRSK